MAKSVYQWQKKKKRKVATAEIAPQLARHFLSTLQGPYHPSKSYLGTSLEDQNFYSYVKDKTAQSTVASYRLGKLKWKTSVHGLFKLSAFKFTSHDHLHC